VDWLIHNPIGDMYGPMFLLVYALAAVLIIATCYAWAQWDGPSPRDAPPQVPSDVDPYELAYLRGEPNEVIRAVVSVLYLRGLIRVVNEGRGFWRRTRLLSRTHLADQEELSDLEGRVLHAVDPPSAPSYLFQRRLRDDVERLCKPYRAALRAQGLLPRPGEHTWPAFPPVLVGTTVLAGLAAYKIVLAIHKGVPNFGFLVLLCFLSLFVLRRVVGGGANWPISARGRAYLKRLRLAYASLSESRRREVGWTYDAADALLIGVFGIAVLAGTSEAAFAKLFATGLRGGGGGCRGGSGGWRRRGLIGRAGALA
jgi:uncharacterized protein (TIGR04222 family)